MTSAFGDSGGKVDGGSGSGKGTAHGTCCIKVFLALGDKSSSCPSEPSAAWNWGHAMDDMDNRGGRGNMDKWTNGRGVDKWTNTIGPNSSYKN